MTVKRLAVLSLAAVLILVVGYCFYRAALSDRQTRWMFQTLFISLGSISVLCSVILFINRLQNRIGDLQNDLRSQSASINDINKKMGGNKNATPKDVQDQIEKLLGEVKIIRETVDSLAAKVGGGDAVKEKAGDADRPGPDDGARDARGGGDWPPVTSEPTFIESVAAGEDLQRFPFPGSVKDYLNYLEKSNTCTFGVRAETLQDGVFVRSADGPFLLIEEDSKADDSFLVIPRIPRFTSTQDYDHYRRYYECANPSAGEVWIVKPATVIKEGHAGEWKLTNKGQLKVES